VPISSLVCLAAAGPQGLETICEKGRHQNCIHTRRANTPPPP
jgi:hypothetical protein